MGAADLVHGDRSSGAQDLHSVADDARSMARQPASYDDPDFRSEERALRRRRLLAAVVMVLALTGVAGGSVAAAVASAHDDRADASSQIVQVH